MILFKKTIGLQQHIAALKNKNKTIGFVPTMGALHKGHISLINASKVLCNVTVCSIFINPTQFNNKEDFAKYPVTIEHDILLLEQYTIDVLFLPSADEIYPHGTAALPHYNLGEIENMLEGKYRPNHFQGVCQVVHKLFEIVKPNKVFFGAKDYQQCMVIKKLITLQALPVEMHIQPTLREENGLAMSSRNMRLNDEQRENASALYNALQHIKDYAFTQEIAVLKAEATNMLMSAGFTKIDYIEIADAATLQPVVHINKSSPSVVLAAAFLGDVRLIDNVLINFGCNFPVTEVYIIR